MHPARTLAVVIAALVVIPAGLLGAHEPPGRSAPAGSGSVVAAPAHALAQSGVHGPVSVATRVQAIESALRARGVPPAVIHLPNLGAMDPGRSGPAQPSYAQGPAPMGISDLGLRNSSGVLTPYVLNTSSVWGSITLTHAIAAYVDGDGPDTFGVQLNAVATNITLFGVPGNEFWTQDFFSYTTSTHELSFGDNVWNFSAANGTISNNVFASFGPNGSLQAPYYYYAVGPTVTVAYPFTVNLYLNATLRGDLPAVLFNYSVTGAGGFVAGGSFDQVAFNASAGPVTSPMPIPQFQANGTGNDPIGLPNDLELVIVGNGNGDTTTFFALNATMALKYWNETSRAYGVVPSAYDAGSDTGETSNGILPVYHTPALGGPPTVTLGIGPSFVDGLWNVSTALDGSRQFRVTERQQNAFLFASPGSSFTPATAQWIPTQRFAAATAAFALPNTGSYSLEWMLSDHLPANYSVSALLPLPGSTTALSENLTVNATQGSYTPLLAWGNAEVPVISQAGAGTVASPYVLIHRATVPLDPVFGEMNDFGFPVFAGVLLVNTTDYIDVVQPAVGIVYGSWMASLLTRLNLSSTNSLQLEFWNVSHVAVLNSTAITGWVSMDFSIFPAAEVMFWGSSFNLIAGDTFRDEGDAVTLYGGNNNTVWGNTFLAGAVTPWVYDGNNTTGVTEWESWDHLYNNYFDVDQPAATPTYDAFSCQIVCLTASYNDTWNVTQEPANATARVLGQTLTGSILGTWYQGGNYWWNYGTAEDPYGQLPYNDHDLITAGGDYVPLVPSTVYPVTFQESGLLPGTVWNVSLFGVGTNSTANTLILYAPNGTYNATVEVPSGYLGPTLVEVVVDGTSTTVAVNFTELFTVTFHVHGLVDAWAWNGTFVATTVGAVNASFNSTSGIGVVKLANGTYAATFAALGYSVTHGPRHVTISGVNRTMNVTFALVAQFSITATGLGSSTPWTVTVVQGSSTVIENGVGDGTVIFTILQLNPSAGRFTWNVSAPGYSCGGNASCAASSATFPTSVSVTFAANPGSAAFPWTWVALAALAALAAAGFALYFRERRRRPRSPKPITPAAPVAAAPAVVAAPVPWDETVTGPSNAPAPAPWEETPSDSEHPEPYGRKP